MAVFAEKISKCGSRAVNPEPWQHARRFHPADVGAALRAHAARALLPRHDQEPPDQLPRLHEELRRHAGRACGAL